MSKTARNRISAFRKDCREVEILKTKKGYGYSYADLDDILNVIEPILERHKLSYLHFADYDEVVDKNVIVTEVYCVDNEEDFIVSRTSIDRTTKLAKMNQLMMEGSAITYFRRYHLVAMLGLLTDEDSDAGGKRKESSSPKTGRSVESAGNEAVGPNYIDIFKNIVKTKPKDKALKTLEIYKGQISNSDIKKINEIINSSYDNK